MLRLHYHPLSTYSRKARVALDYHGAQVECVVLDVLQGALRTEAYLALSPFGKMPVLETPEGPIVETTSIIEYVEERFGPRLIPADGPGKLGREVRHFDRLGDHYLMDPQSILWWRPESKEAQGARRTVHKAWEVFADAIGDKAFVCGDQFTLADLGAAIATDYLERLGEAPPPIIVAWKDRCFAIDAMAQSLKDALPFAEPMLAQRK